MTRQIDSGLRAHEQAEANFVRLTEALEASSFTVESYDRPPRGHYYPQNARGLRVGISWPTGFAGGGWLVRDELGSVVFAAAFRVECLEWVAARELEQEHASGTDFDLEGRS